MPTTMTNLQVKSLMPAMTVNDLQRSLKFYVDGLGFAMGEEYKKDDVVKGAMLQAGSVSMGISQDDFAKGKDRVKGVGLRLYLETDQDIKALADRAKAAGITLKEGPAPLEWGPMGFTVTDPDGFTLTIANPS